MYFARLVELRGEWGFNLMRVIRQDDQMFRVEQFAIPGGEQEVVSPDFKYEKGTLIFVANGRIETVKLHRINEALGDKLLEGSNWDNLQRGLAAKSQKTVDWLVRKGLPVP